MSILNDLLGTVKEIDLQQVQKMAGDQFGDVDDYMARTETKTDPDYARGFVAGLIGGIIGTGVKMIVDRSMPTDQPRGEHDSRIEVVEAAEDMTNANLSNRQEEISQQALNVGFGALIGGVYGIIAEGMPGVQTPGGVPFGAGLWTATHKIALPLLGLAPSAMQKKAGEQLGQLAGHVAYGATVEIVRRGIRHVMDEEDLL